MRYARHLSALSAAWLAACSTPYSPPVVVHGANPFPGIAGLIDGSENRVVDVVLVHGMCTHDATWANARFDKLIKAIDRNAPTMQERSAELPPAAGVHIVERSAEVAGGTVKLTALIWSPLTAQIKRQLAYDSTGTPTDCQASGVCKPQRARLNGAIKDSLLNDCLADALVYQGQSKPAIQDHMIRAMTRALEGSAVSKSDRRSSKTPLVIISDSLGSKITFDALDAMLTDSTTAERVRATASAAVERLALVYMGANQLPLLSLADQNIGQLPAGAESAPSVPEDDSLQRVLRRTSVAKNADGSAQLKSVSLVAFTDPNDLLSYRLRASRYVSPNISIADILVSNSPTYFGLLERPDKAHTEYMSNRDVTTFIACGWPKNLICR